MAFSYPEICIGVLILNPKGKILLVQSHKWRNKYSLPGGHIELGEKIEEAIRREVKEETGLNIYNIQFLHFQEMIFDPVFYKKKHFIFLDFMAKTREQKVKLDSEAQKYPWVKASEALQMPLHQYSRKTIQEYIKKYL